MADPIRPKDLAAAPSVPTTAAIMVDNGVTVDKATPIQVVDAAIPLASQAEAEAGIDNSKRVTALRVKQAIDSQASGKAMAAAIGVSGADANMGTTPGTILSDNGTAKQWFQESEAAIEAKAAAAAFGIAATATDMGSTPTNTNLTPNATARQWFREVGQGTVRTPLQFGAVGDGQNGASATDDTAAIQAALTWFKTTRPATLTRVNQRKLDLMGRQYRVSAPLNLEGCDGLSFANGTLIVDPSTPFASGRAVLEHDVSGVEIWGFKTPGLTIQCNQVANAVNIQRTLGCDLDTLVVYGYGQREFGVRVGPVGYSSDFEMKGARICGYAVSFSDNPVATRTGIGADIQAADSVIIGGNINCGAVPIRIHSSCSVLGAHVWNGNPGNETLAAANNIGIEFVDNHTAASFVSVCTLDNCLILLNGQSLNKVIVGNKFYSNQQQLDYGIIIKATASGQIIGDLEVSGNQLNGYYKRPVYIDESLFQFTAINRAGVHSNPLRTLRTGYNSFTESLSATRGSIVFQCDPSRFNTGVIKFDLGQRGLLLPRYADVLGISVGHVVTTGSGATFQGSSYNNTTGILSMTFSAAFTGRIMISFDQSYMSRLWTAEAP